MDSFEKIVSKMLASLKLGISVGLFFAVVPDASVLIAGTLGSIAAMAVWFSK